MGINVEDLIKRYGVALPKRDRFKDMYKQVYNYIRSTESFEASEDVPEGKKGFSSCVVDMGDGRKMHCLRIYHPSMPSFSPYCESTQSIIKGFLERQ